MKRNLAQVIAAATFFVYVGETFSCENSGREFPGTIYTIQDAQLALLFGRLQKDLYEAQRQMASYRKKVRALDEQMISLELAYDREKDVLLTEIEELKNNGRTAPRLYNSDQRLQDYLVKLLPINTSGYFAPERSQSAPPVLLP